MSKLLILKDELIQVEPTLHSRINKNATKCDTSLLVSLSQAEKLSKDLEYQMETAPNQTSKINFHVFTFENLKKYSHASASKFCVCSNEISFMLIHPTKVWGLRKLLNSRNLVFLPAQSLAILFSCETTKNLVQG